MPGFCVEEEEKEEGEAVKMAWKRAMSAGVTDANGDELWKEAAREDCDTRGSNALRPLARVGVWKDAVDETRVEADGTR